MRPTLKKDICISTRNLLPLSAISFCVSEGRDTNNYSWDSIASCHHVEGSEVGVKHQDYHPEELYTLQTHPAKPCQIEEM